MGGRVKEGRAGGRVRWGVGEEKLLITGLHRSVTDSGRSSRLPGVDSGDPPTANPQLCLHCH